MGNLGASESLQQGPKIHNRELVVTVQPEGDSYQMAYRFASGNFSVYTHGTNLNFSCGSVGFFPLF